MAGGGTAEGMKVSDVFILIGISVLVAGFIIHSWVAPEVLESEDGESAVIEKSALLLKNDKLGAGGRECSNQCPKISNV